MMNEPLAQSTLAPARGSAAAPIGELGVVLYVGGALILAVVSLLALAGVVAGPRDARAKRWILVGGLALPAVLLAALFCYALAVGGAVAAPENGDSLRVQVTGRQWWWEVRYEGGATLANELHIPVGRPVELVLGSSDVIHSFWVPPLAGKVDMIPGRSTRLVIRSNGAGAFRGQCAEYCGAQHALMAFHVVAEPAADFEDWLERQARDAAPSADPAAQRGEALFFRAGCASCHTIRGTAARGRLGPDLTHVGSRRSLAAGTLGNHVGTMGGWIGDAQALKPGSYMPPTDSLAGPELRDLAAWLEGLE
jgi:cytochrome c oxidase subunit 2